jgi:hypothetical protein
LAHLAAAGEEAVEIGRVEPRRGEEAHTVVA